MDNVSAAAECTATRDVLVASSIFLVVSFIKSSGLSGNSSLPSQKHFCPNLTQVSSWRINSGTPSSGCKSRFYIL